MYKTAGARFTSVKIFFLTNYKTQTLCSSRSNAEIAGKQFTRRRESMLEERRGINGAFVAWERLVNARNATLL